MYYYLFSQFENLPDKLRFHFLVEANFLLILHLFLIHGFSKFVVSMANFFLSSKFCNLSLMVGFDILNFNLCFKFGYTQIFFPIQLLHFQTFMDNFGTKNSMSSKISPWQSSFLCEKGIQFFCVRGLSAG